MTYTHTDSSQGGTTFNMIGGNNTWKSTSKSIGWSLDEEHGSCDDPDYFTGSHLHQYHSGSGWTKNSIYPNAPATGSYSVTLNGNYQVRRGWTLQL